MLTRLNEHVSLHTQESNLLNHLMLAALKQTRKKVLAYDELVLFRDLFESKSTRAALDDTLLLEAEAAGRLPCCT